MLISFDPGNLELPHFLQEQVPEGSGSELVEVPLGELVIFEQFNSRQSFDETELQRLADSFAQVGVRIPIEVVAGLPGSPAEGKYMVIAGERRGRAAERLMLRSIPALVVRHTRRSALLANIIENEHRRDLSAWERAHAIRRLHEDEALGFDEIGVALGCTAPHVRNLYRCATKLDEEVAEGWKRNPGASTDYVVHLAARPHEEQRQLWREWLASRGGQSKRSKRKGGGGSGPRRRPSARTLQRYVAKVRAVRSSGQSPRPDLLELAELLLGWAASGEPTLWKQAGARLGIYE